MVIPVFFFSFWPALAPTNVRPQSLYLPVTGPPQSVFDKALVININLKKNAIYINKNELDWSSYQII